MYSFNPMSCFFIQIFSFIHTNMNADIQVELALAYGCAESLSKERILDYIHHNRLNNALRITSIGKIQNVDKIWDNNMQNTIEM